MEVHGVHNFCPDNARTVISRGKLNKHTAASLWTERTGCIVGMYSIGRIADATEKRCASDGVLSTINSVESTIT